MPNFIQPAFLKFETISEHGNARPVQNLNGDFVVYDVTTN